MRGIRRRILGGLVAGILVGPPDGRRPRSRWISGSGATPPLVAVPGTPVAYAPAVATNYFFYAGQYYVYADGAWYVSPGFNRPWVLVAPEFVPPPLLAVLIQYYHRPPIAWRQWRRDAPPRWEPRWGRHREPRDDRLGRPGQERAGGWPREERERGHRG